LSLGATSDETLAVLKSNLGINDAEVRALLPVLAGGNMTIGAVALISGDKLQTVEKALDGLRNKGLVSRVDSVVPIYRAIPPFLIMEEDLSSTARQTDSLAETSRKTLDSQEKELEELAETIKKAGGTMSTELSQLLEEQDSTLIDEERTSANSAIESSAGDMNGFCQAAESIIKEMGDNLAENLSGQLTDVQSETDKAQTDIQTDIRNLNKDLDQEVRREQDASMQAIADLGKRTKAVVQEAKAAVKTVLVNDMATLRQAMDGLSGVIESRLSDIVNEAAGQLAASSDELARSLDQVALELDQSGAETRKSITGLVSISRQAANGIAKSTRQTIENAARVTESLGTDVSSWSEESNSSIASVSEGLAVQFAQVASANTSYLEAMKNAISTYLDKSNTSVDQAFNAVGDLLSGIQGQIESFTADSRASIAKLVQAQASASRDRIDNSAGTLGAGLEKWATDTGRGLQRKLTQAGNEAGTALDGEAEKLSSLTGDLGNKLSSAFESVLTTTTESNKATISGTKKAFREFDTDMASKLTEIVSNLTSTAGVHVRESTAFYHGIRSSLDTRLEQSVASVTSHVERMQNQIDEAIDDQASRIERQTEAIRKEFRARVDEIAKQHSDLAESLGSVLGGLLSSQGLETRDLIGSAHAQFRNAVKAELTSLQEDSTKLKKEYASEIEDKVTEVTASYNEMKKALDELVAQKRVGVSRTMTDMLSRIGATTTDIEAGLRGIETGTIQEIIGNLTSASGEFGTSLAAARGNLSSRIGSIADSAVESVNKAISSMKATLDEYISAEKDVQQRVPSDIGKKLDVLSTKVLKESGQRNESSKTEVAARKAEATKAWTAANKETEALLQSQMSEDEQALNESSESVKTTLLTASSTVTALTGKLTDKIGRMQKSLARGAEDAESGLVKRSEGGISQFEEAAIAILVATEDSFKVKAAALGSACSSSLDKSMKTVSDLPTSIAEPVLNALNDAVVQVEASNSEALDGLSTQFSGCETASKSVTDGLGQEVGRYKDSVAKSVGSFSERTKQSVVNANQRVSKKIETARKGVRTQIASSSSRMMENLRNEVTAKVSEISGITEQFGGQMEESIGRAKESRAEALSHFDLEVETAVDKWRADQDGNNREVRTKTEEVVHGLESAVSKTMKAMEAIRAVSADLTKTQPESTWYLTGNDEVRAHIVDMAQRAQQSIVIATASLRGLDIKRAAKPSDSVRRVLIIPESEEQQPAVKDLAGIGWHVRKTASPMTLAMMDNKEVLIGGTVESTRPLVLVSSDKTYLQLFHDVIGPQLLIRPPPPQTQRAPSTVQPD
jgi:sugar-specific transcriptional regulator TrmB